MSLQLQAFDRLRRACGYVENGTSETVKIYQDDATREWVVTIGQTPRNTRHYYGPSLTDAIMSIPESHLGD